MRGNTYFFALFLSCSVFMGGADFSFANEIDMIQKVGLGYNIMNKGMPQDQIFSGIQALIPETKTSGNHAVLTIYSFDSNALAQSSVKNTSVPELSGHFTTGKQSSRGNEPLMMLMFGVGMISFSEILKRIVVARNRKLSSAGDFLQGPASGRSRIGSNAW